MFLNKDSATEILGPSHSINVFNSVDDLMDNVEDGTLDNILR